MAEIRLLTPKEISHIYGLPRSTVYELLNISVNPCPKIKGGNGKRYIVEQSAFEAWLKGRNV